MQEQSILRAEIMIRGQYVLENVLGRSGSGATYLVRDQRAKVVRGNLFVLKEVVEPNKQARHRLAAQGKLLRRLHHPGLPLVHQVFNDGKNNRVYLLMEYIAGHDLETLRQQRHEKVFAWTEVMHMMAPIIAAVTYLHQQRPPILHSDIKPANIVMPGEDRGVVLVDFGMIKASDPGSSTAAGRYCYRAPEQYSGRIDVRTDIYALGATFYTLVTGKLPPDARSRLIRAGSSAMDHLEPVNSVAPATPMYVGNAIERAMALDAELRFSSVEQFWEALWLVLADHRVPVFDQPSVPQGSIAPPMRVPGQAVGQTLEQPVPAPIPVVSTALEEQEANTIRLEASQQQSMKRWLLYQSLKNKHDSDYLQGDSSSSGNGEDPTQSIPPPAEIASERPDEKSLPLPETRSPLELPESTLTDSSTKTQSALPSLSDQNGRTDQGSLWPGMDIEMSFSQSDWEWSVSSKQEQDGQQEA